MRGRVPRPSKYRDYCQLSKGNTAYQVQENEIRSSNAKIFNNPRRTVMLASGEQVGLYMYSTFLDRNMWRKSWAAYFLLKILSENLYFKEDSKSNANWTTCPLFNFLNRWWLSLQILQRPSTENASRCLKYSEILEKALLRLPAC